MKKCKLSKVQHQRRARRKTWTNAERQENVLKNKARLERLKREAEALTGSV